jgi:hypothetical protein
LLFINSSMVLNSLFKNAISIPHWVILRQADG